MQEFGITILQTKPSLFKDMTVSKIVDKRKQKDIEYFISARYENLIKDVLKEIEKNERLEKLNRLKKDSDDLINFMQNYKELHKSSISIKNI